MNPTSVNASNGTSEISFTCSATGFPEPEIQWMKEDDSLPLSASGQNTDTFTIGPVLFGDEGLYYCVATSNQLSAESERATLYSELIPLMVCISIHVADGLADPAHWRNTLHAIDKTTIPSCIGHVSLPHMCLCAHLISKLDSKFSATELNVFVISNTYITATPVISVSNMQVLLP